MAPTNNQRSSNKSRPSSKNPDPSNPQDQQPSISPAQRSTQGAAAKKPASQGKTTKTTPSTTTPERRQEQTPTPSIATQVVPGPSQPQAVVASIPIVNEPQHTASPTPTVVFPPANTPLYGSLNQRNELFFIQTSAVMLKAVISSAPQAIRTQLPAKATKDLLLAEVLRLRQHEALSAQVPALNPEESLRKVITMSTDELLQAASSDLPKLRASMKAALHADSTIRLNRVDLDTATMNDLVTTALDWQVQAHKAAVALIDPPPPAVATQTPATRPHQQAGSSEMHRTLPREGAPLPTLTGLLANPSPRAAQPGSASLPFPLADTSDEEDQAPPKKKTKQLIEPQGFTCGTAANIEQVLRHYPGKGILANSLNVGEMRGPEILAQIIGTGAHVQAFLGTFKHWKRNSAGNPTQAEIEAHTLGRMMHSELLKAKDPIEALQQRPSLEIGLRRLYAILYVEEAVNTGMVRDRGTAWRNIQFILESLPQGTVMSDPINEEMTRKLSLHKKRIAAVKAMEDVRARRSRNQQNNNGGQNNGGQNNGGQNNGGQNNNNNRRGGAQGNRQ